MSIRTVQVEIERIGRWVTNFARRHGGAVIADDDGTHPATHADDDGTHPAAQADDDGTHLGAHDGEAHADRDPHTLRLRGADGEVAVLHRWPRSPGGDGARPAPAPAPAPAPGDATTPENLDAIAAWCTPPTHLGLILIRRGGYAVGRAEGPTLATHKTGTRYVQARTAAGGWSQQRFARRRGNQADALVGTVVDLAAAHLLPPPVGTAPHLPEAIVLGGDRALADQVLAGQVLRELASLPRRLFADLPEPRFAVLQTALQRGRSIPVQIIPAVRVDP